MMDTISIIIPIYNTGDNLRKTLDSVLGQSYSALQIICVNDGSTDGSLEILREYQQNDARIEVISQENSGVSMARNAGLKLVKGKYILFLDGDDWLEATACQEALEALHNTDSDLVMFPYIREMKDKSLPKKIYEEHRIFEREQVLEQLHRRMVGIIGEELKHPECADALCTVWGKLYKSDLILNHHIIFYDIRKIGTYEDGLFNLDVLPFVYRAVYIPKYLYHYRRDNADSITNRYNENLRKQWNRLFHIIARYVKSHHCGSDYIEALYNRIALSLIVLAINEVESTHSHIGKVNNIRFLIDDPLYRKAINRLDMSYFPIHWKMFFLAAKYRCSIAIYALTLAIQKLRGR